MKVSIVITNYNYARYIGQAIESALAQTYGDVQVIVVDDGSTDSSWDEIRRYAGRIEAVRIKNSGQGGATNVGLQMADGELVLMLDSDDYLDPHTIATCVPLFKPDVAKVQFSMRRIDADGRFLGGTVPYLMHEGDVRPIIRAFGHYSGPPSSGNFYRRSAIARYYPLEPTRWRRAVDTVPFLLAAFNGRVVNAPGTLGYYRLHRANNAPGMFGNVGRSFAEQLRVEETRRDETLALLAQHDGIVVKGPYLPQPWSVRTRVLSWRLDRAHHPYPEDTLASILRQQFASVRAWPGYRPSERCAALLWVAAAGLLPAPLVTRLARTNTSGAVRTAFKRIAGRALT